MKRLAAALLAVSMVLVTACSSGSGANSSGQTQSESQGTTGIQETGSTSSTKPTTLKLTGEKDTSKTLTTFVTFEPPPGFHGNPYAETAGPNWSLQPLLYEPLCDYSPLPEREYRPAALESYEVDGKTLTMKLRSDLKWSDGSPVTVDDLMTMLYLEAGRSTLWQVMESAEKVDDSTVRVQFINESPLNLNLLLPNFIMAPTKIYGQWADELKAYVEKYRVWDEANNRYKFDTAGDDVLANITAEINNYKPDAINAALYSGPYVLKGMTSAEAIFEKNPYYYMDIDIQKVRAVRTQNSEAFAAAVQEQTFTVENGGMSPELTAQVEKKFEATLRTIYTPQLSQIGYLFNVQKYPFNIPEVRKAFAYMMDRDTLLKLAEPGSFNSDVHGSGLLPSLIPTYTNEGFMDTLPDYSYNPTKAEELLTSIGWKKVNGKWANEKGKPVKIEIVTVGTWPSLMYPSEALSTMLQEAGWEVEFKPMESANVLDYMSKGEHQVACYFVPGMSTYAHPWEVYQQTYLGAYATRMNFPALKAGEDRVITAPSTGKQYNVTQILAKLYQSTDEKEIKELTQELATVTSDYLPFIGLIEKTAPLRIYDTKLSVADGEIGQSQISFYWYGNLNNMLMKQLRAGELYFVK